MFQRRAYAPGELISAGLRVNAELLEGMHELARLQGFDSTTKWLRATLLPVVAQGLGVPEASLLPPPPPKARAAPPSPVRLPDATPSQAAGAAMLNAFLITQQEELRKVLDRLGGVAAEAPAADPTPVRKPIRRR